MNNNQIFIKTWMDDNCDNENENEDEDDEAGFTSQFEAKVPSAKQIKL